MSLRLEAAGALPRDNTDSHGQTKWPGQREFVALIAALMALNALSIDIVLPALGIIGEAYRGANGNDIQLLVTAYVVTFGLGQLLVGPFMDHFGRRPLLFVALSVFVIGNLAAVVAPTFDLMLAARALQGAAASVLRVGAVAIVRDRYQGREMAKVMSTVMMIFMVVPLFAPAIGQAILLVGPWPFLFVVTGIIAAGVLIWAALRLPESLSEGHRQKANLATVVTGVRIIFSNSTAIGYMVASGFVFGNLFSYVTASNQIMLEVYEIGAWFPLAFAATAMCLGITNFINSRIVERFGMRLLAHSTLILLVAGTGLHAVLAKFGVQPFWLFMVLSAVPFISLGFLGANMTALSLDPLGKVTGLATSLQGFITTGVAGALGTLVAQSFDGTARPFAYGSALLSVAALGIVIWTERGQLRLFRSPPSGKA